MERKTFRLISNDVRQRAIDHIWGSPDGYVVVVQEQTRNLEMNAKFHAICGELEKLGVKWMGKKHSLNGWKVLLVSGHAVATGHEAEIVTGLEGELVNVRESTADMAKSRGSSLIEYSQAFLENHRC